MKHSYTLPPKSQYSVSVFTADDYHQRVAADMRTGLAVNGWVRIEDLEK